jgi:hypothetical protein
LIMIMWILSFVHLLLVISTNICVHLRYNFIFHSVLFWV